MFEFATKNHVRFPYKGMISVEDLWDLSVTELDKVFKALNAQKKQSQEESLLATKTREEEILEKQIGIVKYIVGVKLDEKRAREVAAENRAKKQRILEIKAARDDAALLNASDEELDKMLAELN